MLKAMMQAATFGLAGALAGCYAPGGGMMPRTGGPQTFVSTELMQKTIVIYDTRTNEALHTFEIPPGKQLVLDFDDGEGDNPVNTPDLLRWDILDKGTRFGKLHRAMSVPDAASRRLEVMVHRGPAYVAESPLQALRTDQPSDRPDWWTPKGGPMPEDKRTGMYDN